MTNPKSFRHFTDKVVSVLGGTVGNGVNFLLSSINPEMGGAAGALLAPGIATLIVEVGNELSSRVLGPREEYRVGTVFALAVQEIQSRIQNGESPRSDGFFTDDIGCGRTVAAEVWESALMKGAREAQEKKLPYMAHLLAGLVFSSSVSEGEAHQLLHWAEGLTYQKLCILRAMGGRPHFYYIEHRIPEMNDDYDYSVLGSLMSDVIELVKGDFLFSWGHAFHGEESILAQPLTVGGSKSFRLYDLMQLGTIPVEDVEPIMKMLSFSMSKEAERRRNPEDSSG